MVSREPDDRRNHRRTGDLSAPLHRCVRPKCRSVAGGRISAAVRPFKLHFGGIASGDEDVVDAKRRSECQQLSGALAVAWEGAGGARACAFSQVPFLEIRAIVDNANEDGPRDFRVNLRMAMQNLAQVLRAFAKSGMASGERDR